MVSHERMCTIPVPVHEPGHGVTPAPFRVTPTRCKRCAALGGWQASQSTSSLASACASNRQLTA